MTIRYVGENMDYIRQTVETLVDLYETRDPFELAKSQGIEVFHFPFSKIKGMVIKVLDQTIIALNSELSYYEQRIILAHELGHHALSPAETGYFFISENTLMEPKIEYQANRFAVELLTGDKEPNVGESTEQFAARVGIPKEMMRYIWANRLMSKNSR